MPGPRDGRPDQMPLALLMLNTALCYEVSPLAPALVLPRSTLGQNGQKWTNPVVQRLQALGELWNVQQLCSP